MDWEAPFNACFYYWATEGGPPSIFLIFCTFPSFITICSFFLSNISEVILCFFFNRIIEAKPHLNQPFISLLVPWIFYSLSVQNLHPLILVELMSGLYNQISSPSTARANSPNINMRSNFEAERWMDWGVILLLLFIVKLKILIF